MDMYDQLHIEIGEFTYKNKKPPTKIIISSKGLLDLRESAHYNQMIEFEKGSSRVRKILNMDYVIGGDEGFTLE